jgi:hypothetical protein
MDFDEQKKVTRHGESEVLTDTGHHGCAPRQARLPKGISRVQGFASTATGYGDTNNDRGDGWIDYDASLIIMHIQLWH